MHSGEPTEDTSENRLSRWIKRPVRCMALLTKLVVTNFLEKRCHKGQLYGKSEIVAHKASSYGRVYCQRVAVKLT